MDADETPIIPQVEREETFWDRHRFTLLLIFTVIIAIVLTCVSMVMYTASGTAQLDLSRPGYQSVSDKVDRETKIDEYDAFGPVTTGTIKEFRELYDEQAAKAKAVDAFNGDPLNPEILEASPTTGE